MSRLLIAVAFAATTLFSASPTLAGPIVPEPGDCNVIAMSADHVSRKGTGYNYDLHKYGGDGCEVGGSYSYNHQVRLETPLPAGMAMPVKVPVVSLLQIDGHITGGSGYFFDVQSVVNGQGPDSSFIHEDSFSYSKSVSSLVLPDTNFVASVRGYVSLLANAGQTTSAQLIVDPGYAYADYFGLYQKKSDGTWVELNRNWIQPGPVPETWIMRLTGLGLLGAGVCRRTTLRTIRPAGAQRINSLDVLHAVAASVTLKPGLATAAPICAMSLPGLAAKGLFSCAPHAHC